MFKIGEVTVEVVLVVYRAWVEAVEVVLPHRTTMMMMTTTMRTKVRKVGLQAVKGGQYNVCISPGHIFHSSFQWHLS